MKIDSEKVEEFIDQFQQDPQTAAHLVGVKRLYRKLRAVLVLLLILVYGVIIAATALEISTESGPAYVLLMILAGLFLLISLATAIIYLDMYRNELSNDELALHEFSQAILQFRKDPPEYQKWKDHLMNSQALIIHHDAQIFSSYMEDQVLTYISWVEETDADNPTKANFEEFIQMCLVDLVDERNTEYNWNNQYNESETGPDGYLSVFIQSIKNIVGRSRFKSWFPIIGVLLIGFTIFFTYDEQTGSLFTIALLTVISVMKSGGE